MVHTLPGIHAAFGLLLSLLLLGVAGGFSSDQLPKLEAKTPGSSTDRRDFLKCSSLLLAACVSAPQKAQAVGEGAERMVFRQKPTAPIGALLPAIQQRLLLEAAVELASKPEQEETLKSILLPLEDNNNVGKNQDLKVLKRYNPAQVLRGDLTRATMNLYQTNLNYNNLLGGNNNNNPNELAFEITDPEWKKSYIRAHNGLPDLPKVIGADLDMRQLLRNQVQLKLDDAAAELYAPGGCDAQELQSLLKEAAQAFDQWLDRVRPENVQDAAAWKGETIQIYEPYAAGFLPNPAR